MKPLLMLVLLTFEANVVFAGTNLLSEASSFEVGIDNGFLYVPIRPYSVSAEDWGSVTVDRTTSVHGASSLCIAVDKPGKVFLKLSTMFVNLKPGSKYFTQ